MIRLRRLTLDAFGHFSGQRFDFGDAPADGPDFHIIHGANEAGKSTTMEAWLRLLYGFPHREPYAFRHGRPNLKVSAELDIDGDVRTLARLPKKTATLLDERGESLPETMVSASLGGLSSSDYRKLFCLDDLTIESGGEEIVASRGDIGRLLFSAAAGLAELSPVLEIGTSRADAFFRERATKTRLAVLKRELNTCRTAIRERDVSAETLRRTRRRVEAAEQTIIDLGRERDARRTERARLDAWVTAFPIAARLRRLDDEVAPLARYPATLEIDPEDLVALLTERHNQVAEHDRHAAIVADRTRALEATSVERSAVDTLPSLDRLRALRERSAAAREARPRLLKALETLRDDIARLARSLGVEHAPSDLGLPEPDALDELDTHLQRVRQAERLWEEREATREEAEHVSHETALAAERSAVAAVHPLATLLERHDVEPTLAAAQRADGSLAQSAATFRQRCAAVAGLEPGADPDAVELPALSVTADEIDALAREAERATGEHERAERERAAAHTRLEGERAALASLEAELGATDERTAMATRRVRDEAWIAHRATLDTASAETFERAMRDDDATTASRLAGVASLGEIRSRRATIAALEIEMQGLIDRRREAVRARDRVSQRHEAARQGTRAVGGRIEDFAKWVRTVESAVTAAQDLAYVRASVAATRAAARALEHALADALNAPGTPLDALVARARDTLKQHSEARETHRLAAQAARDAKTRFDQCRERVAVAARSRDEAEAGWRAAVLKVVGDAIPEGVLRNGLPTLRRLCERLGEQRRDERVLARLDDDIAAFERGFTALTDAVKDRDEPSDEPSVAANADTPDDEAIDALRDVEARYDAAVVRARAAQRDLERATRLEHELDDARTGQDEARRRLADIDARVALLGRSFDASIETDSIDALRAAVATTRRAIDLRAERDATLERLMAILGVDDRAAALARLQDRTLADCEAARDAIDATLDGLDERLQTAYEARANAEAARSAITGEDDIARLRAEQQMLLEEIEAGARDYLQERLGSMLAERAISRYRDRHRSGMMERAEVAFVQLTNGAYTRLEARHTGDGEVLVAREAGQGAARQVDALSKGTRFQLYLALRAAAYEQTAATGTVLPFFCDDVFETFDEARTRAACEVMSRIGRTGQAVYLTHHAHVVDIARDVCGPALRIHRIGGESDDASFDRVSDASSSAPPPASPGAS